MLIEFGGLPGSGKTTLSAGLADHLGAVLLRIDTIEDALRRNGITPGPAAYSVAHDLAAAHLRRGFTVIADAVSGVAAARAGWSGLAAELGVRHAVVETVCADPAERRRRIAARGQTDSGFDGAYEPRTDDRLVVDTAKSVDSCRVEIERYLDA
jgi:predicted kinase